MHYQLTCTCGTTHAVTTSQAGQSITCSCGQKLEIPTLRGLQELPRIDASTSKSAPISSDTTAKGRPAIATGILLALFFIALPTTIFLTYVRWQMDTSQSEESERNAAFEAIDQATPTALSDAWSQYSSVALGPPGKPNFYYAEQYRRRIELGLGAAAVITLLSGLGAALLASRQPTPAKSVA